MSFFLTEDRIAVVADKAAETTKAGLIVPESGQDTLRYGTVSYVGTGNRDQSGFRISPDITVGDRVFFHRASGGPLEIEDVEYVILRESEIIGVVDKESA